MKFLGANDAIQVTQVGDHFEIKIDKTKLSRRSKQYSIDMELEDDTGVTNLRVLKILVDVKY